MHANPESGGAGRPAPPDQRPPGAAVPDPRGPNVRPAAGRLLALGLEVVLTVASCLVFYAVFIAILGVVFPDGPGLRDLIGRARATGVDVSHLARPGGSGGDDSTVAVLAVLNRDVRTKRADEIVWGPAADGVVLSGGDGVMTESRGSARVAFDDENSVVLGGNTLIVIRAGSEGDADRRQSEVAVVSGELWAELSPKADRRMDLHVDAAGVRARVRAGTGQAAASTFKVSVDEHRRPTFAVYGGVADIETQGRMVRISGNQSTTVDSTGPMTPVSLPSAPILAAPAEGARLPGSRGGVPFSWEATPGAEGYRLVVARDPGFQQRVLDQHIASPRWVGRRFKAGEYVWRVSAIRGGGEGMPSPPRAFTVERSALGPPLRVEFPTAKVRGDRCRLEGTTEPGAAVLAGGRRAVADARGRFALVVTLKRGVNVVVVEAIAAQGNSSYASAVVHAKF